MSVVFPVGRIRRLCASRGSLGLLNIYTVIPSEADMKLEEVRLGNHDCVTVVELS